MLAPDVFVDTNILLYSISTDSSESVKAALARQVLGSTNWGWSAQVAAEFIHAATSSRRPMRLTLAQARQWIDIWLGFPLAAVDAAVIKEAIRLAERFGISYFDAQILAAAKILGCNTLVSEDLNHGQDYDGVIVVNPLLMPSP